MAETRPGLFKRLGNYYGEVRAEMKKVTWPSKAELYGSTVVVVTVAIVFSIMLGITDSMLVWILERLMTRS
jgi:preprotein translocase subunit SecE